MKVNIALHLFHTTVLHLTTFLFYVLQFLNPLEEDSLGTILDTVHALTAKWFVLGLALGLPTSVVRQIEYDHPRDSLRCLTEVITAWLRSNSQASWQGLASALRLPSVGEFVLATKIAKAHPSH